MDQAAQHDISLLRQQLWSKSLGAKKPVAIPSFNSWLAEAFARAASAQKLWLYRNSEDRVKAYLALDDCFDPFFGQNVERVLFNYEESDSEARAWIKQSFRENLPRAHAGSHLLLSPAYAELWPILQEKGYGISEVAFGGFPSLAFTELLKSPARQNFSPTAQNLSVEPVRSLADVPKIRALREAVFSDEPERCWFYKNPGVAEQFDLFTKQRIEGGTQWKITRGGRLLGSFGFGRSERQLFGKEAAMDFAVLKELHGLGIGRFAYRLMLETMLKEGYEYFSGATANPSVVHLARTMRRPVQHFEIRAAANCVDAKIFPSSCAALAGNLFF